MANPQKENGYTSIANEILEHLYRLKLNGTQFRIIMSIWRFTYGFSRKQHEMSESFISQATETHIKQVSRELASLIEMNIIKVVKEASFKSSRIISFNKNYDTWILKCVQGANQLPPYEIEDGTGSELVTLPGSELAPQENNILKQNIKQASVSLDEELKKNFEIIYSIYPKKVGKQTAYDNYKKWITGRKIDSKKVKLTNRQIYIAVCGYVKSKEEAGTELKYYKDFSTLMGKQLLDYMPEEREEDAD